MSSTYSTNLRLDLMATGDQAGSWGTTTNTNLGTLLEQAIAGYTTVTCTGGTDTLLIPDGASGNGRNMYIQLNGIGGGIVQVPVYTKLYFIFNNTASAIVVKTVAGTGVTVPAAGRLLLVCDGTNVVNAINLLNGNATTATTTTNAVNANNITNAGGWSVTPSGTKLYFNYNGTNVASLDSTGNLITIGNVTAYGTP